MSQRSFPFQDPELSPEARVADLLGRMSPAEKIGQLQNRLKGWDCWHRGPDGPEPTEAFRTALRTYGLGSVYGVFRADPFSGIGLDTALGFSEGAALANRLQREAMEASRWGIPLLFAEETLHGLMAVGATTFPSPLTLACAWDEDLVRQIGAAIALETRTQGVHLAYSPVCDLALDPRWSRCDECFGEDPALASALAVAMVQGHMGRDASELARDDRVGPTLKAFAAHGGSVGGFTSGPVSCGPNELRRLHLRPFRAAVEAGAVSLMACHTAIDGVPCHANRELLTDVLREEWGFRGFVLADGNGIDLLGIDRWGFGHECVRDLEEAGAVALRAGIDSSLWDEAFLLLESALASGRVSMEEIDRACARILRVKFQMGVFERPFVDEGRRAALGTDPHVDLAAEAARRSIVLLENRDDFLPLNRSPRTLAVLGPNADRAAAYLGDYVPVRARDTVSTVLDGLRRRFPAADLRFEPGCALRAGDDASLARAVAAATGADLAVIVVGGSSNRGEAEQNPLGQSVLGEGEVDNGEGISKADTRLWPCQRRLIEAVADTGTPVVLVLIQGRPHTLGDLADRCAAVLCAGAPGQAGGDAIAAVIAGDVEPEGRLAVAVPQDPCAIPATHRRPLLARQRYVDVPTPVQYPLGYGLGYTTWSLGTPAAALSEETIEIRVPVTNTGRRPGTTVVQAYVHIPGGIPVRPYRELAAWRRVTAPAGGTLEAILRIPIADLGLAGGRWTVAVHVGFDSEKTAPPCEISVGRRPRGPHEPTDPDR